MPRREGGDRDKGAEAFDEDRFVGRSFGL